MKVERLAETLLVREVLVAEQIDALFGEGKSPPAGPPPVGVPGRVEKGRIPASRSCVSEKAPADRRGPG